MSVDIDIVLAVSAVLFFSGLWGAVRHCGDMMRLILSLQLVFLGALFNFAAGGALSGDAGGFAFSLMIVALTGVQITVCLTLFLLYFRRHRHLNSEKIDSMKG